jgi:hypothetical protein
MLCVTKAYVLPDVDVIILVFVFKRATLELIEVLPAKEKTLLSLRSGFCFVLFSEKVSFTACYIQLMIILGLCLDGGKSLSSKFFRSSFMQFLGRISMALYLIHCPIIYWIKVSVVTVVEFFRVVGEIQ